jgi:hypothetical protein
MGALEAVFEIFAAFLGAISETLGNFATSRSTRKR